ncbi:hypothetical protein QFC21_005596 [Naganishia friedmannii]|uniref:Uncharacterized protein n=1 Tax=Naganishia friedmannii TaxID=89922 RepID=A0ACC2V794_9TREE|nr:hypothetical protein QFC21_005596 [Naganishia friedmannii]
MAKVPAVARAKGLTVPEGTEEKLMKQCTDVKEGLPGSMMFDCLAGRPMEVEVRMYAIIKALDWKNAHRE